jgi:hypothetical protein
MTLTSFVTRVTGRVALREQELYTLSENLSSPLFLVGDCVAQSFVFCVVFYIALFVLCPFSFLTIYIVCILCPSSDFGFSFHLWCLQTFLKIGCNKTNVKMFIKTKNGNTIVFVMEQYWEMKFLFYTSECMAHWDYLSKLTHYSTIWYNHQCYQNRQYWEMKFLFYTSECMAHWDYLSKLTHYSIFWYNHQCYQNRQYWEMKFLFYTSECMAHWYYLSKLTHYSTIW